MKPKIIDGNNYHEFCFEVIVICDHPSCASRKNIVRYWRYKDSPGPWESRHGSPAMKGPTVRPAIVGRRLATNRDLEAAREGTGPQPRHNDPIVCRVNKKHNIVVDGATLDLVLDMIAESGLREVSIRLLNRFVQEYRGKNPRKKPEDVPYQPGDEPRVQRWQW